ncbi:unnamed protein product, partial [marine sediment metagenome]
PEVFKEVHKSWIENALKPENIVTHVAVDSQEEADMLSDYDVQVIDNPRKGVVKPIYEMTKDLRLDREDIIIVPSDDFYSFANWDMYLYENMREFYGVLKVNDGHMKDIISMPVMKYPALETMNHVIYHPAYNHMFCDKELHSTAYELGLCRAVPMGDPVFEHKHWAHSTREKDEHDDINDAGYNDGKEIYIKRMNLDIGERLKV